MFRSVRPEPSDDDDDDEEICVCGIADGEQLREGKPAM